jgi:hypothetical protein
MRAMDLQHALGDAAGHLVVERDGGIVTSRSPAPTSTTPSASRCGTPSAG